MTQLTKDDLKQVLKEVGVVIKNDLKVMGVVTEKVLKKELNKTKKELIQAISMSSTPFFARTFYVLQDRNLSLNFTGDILSFV